MAAGAVVLDDRGRVLGLQRPGLPHEQLEVEQLDELQLLRHDPPFRRPREVNGTLQLQSLHVHSLLLGEVEEMKMTESSDAILIGAHRAVFQIVFYRKGKIR